MSDFRLGAFTKRSWRHHELLEVFPSASVRIMDLGSGASPFRGRPIDIVESVDFAAAADHHVDVVKEWPFDDGSFDMVYASHVIEHFYPHDRDCVVRNVWRALRPGGLFFFRVPHKSNMQAVGWEHHTLYGLNAAYGLCNGGNPALPQFEEITFGAACIDVSGFYRERRPSFEPLLNLSHNLAEKLLSRLMYGGIPEVQFLLRRPRSDAARSCFSALPCR